MNGALYLIPITVRSLMVVSREGVMYIDLLRAQHMVRCAQEGNLTGRPLISDPCKRSRALSAARMSNYKTGLSYTLCPKTSVETHICYKYHAPVCDKVKKGFDLSMLFKHSANIITVGFVLCALRNCQSVSLRKNDIPCGGNRRQ
jgi:hypothetical protein